MEALIHFSDAALGVLCRGRQDMIAALFFWIAFLLESFYLVLFVWTIRSKSFRFWPPPSARSWQFFLAWIIAALVMVCFLFLGLFDFDSFILPAFGVRAYLALPFIILGIGIGGWASLSFTLRTTLGLGDRLINKGPYRFSRNPQYIGDSLIILGYFLLTNSWMVGLTGFMGVVLNLLAPFTEEPWLEVRFGDAYRDYQRHVPRFIGWKR